MLCSLVGRAPACLAAVKAQRYQGMRLYSIFFFLDLRDSMKYMVKYGLDQSKATWNQVSGYVCIGQRTGQSV